MLNSNKLRNPKKYIDLGVSGLDTTFKLLEFYRSIKPEVLNRSSSLHKQGLISSRIIISIQSNHKILKNALNLGVSGWKISFRLLGLKRLTKLYKVMYTMMSTPSHHVKIMEYLPNIWYFESILRLFDVLPNFPFTTSETIRDYYL